MAKFMKYYGYKYHEVYELDTYTLNKLIDCMVINEARDALYQMEAISYPHMSKENAKSVHKKYYDKAIPVHLRHTRAVTTEQLNAIYGDFGSIESVLKKGK